MVSGSAVTQVKAVILGPVRRIPLGTGPEVVGKVLGTVRLAILGGKPEGDGFRHKSAPCDHPGPRRPDTIPRYLHQQAPAGGFPGRY